MLGRGPRATVYAARQLSLDRLVALEIFSDGALGDRVRALRWPEHPGAAHLYDAGVREGDPWLARQLGTGVLGPQTDVTHLRGALDAAHAMGVVHGAISPQSIVVVDGRALLSGFGLGPPGAAPQDDRLALDALLRAVARRRRPRPVLGAGLLAGLAATGATAALLLPGESQRTGAPAGTYALGALDGEGVESVDCTGAAPSGDTPACSLMPDRVDGREVAVPRAGTIVGWEVRGARGLLALQVLRPATGGLVEVDRAEVRVGDDEGVLPARLAVGVGDRLSLDVAPDATVGVRRDAGEARFARWVGPLRSLARRPEGRRLRGALQLRVHIRPGSGPAQVAALRGDAAARARGGFALASRDVPVGEGSRRVLLSAVGDAVAVDLFDGTVRKARIGLEDADSRGRLVRMAPRRGAVRVVWSNPDDRRLTRLVLVAEDTLRGVLAAR